MGLKFASFITSRITSSKDRVQKEAKKICHRIKVNRKSDVCLIIIIVIRRRRGWEFNEILIHHLFR